MARDLELLREKHKTAALTRTAAELRENGAECPHGVRAGAEINPNGGEPFCPACRMAARAAGHGAAPGPETPDDAGEAADDDGAEQPVQLAAIPVYPAGSVAGPLADLVTSCALPAALVGGAGLGALAGVCGLADLAMPDGSLVRPVLWIPLVGARGAGKTPAMDAAFGLLRELDAAEHERYRQELDDWREKPARERGEYPPDPTRRIDDATLESLARWLDRGDGTGLVEADELSGWLQSIGQYKRVSGDKGRWLALWSAQPWRYQRVGNEREGGTDFYIRRSAVSVVGGIQPHLHHLLGDEDSGFRPRWLPHMAPPGQVEWGNRHHVPRLWDEAIAALYGLRKPREWSLDGEALSIWRAASREWKRQARGAESASTSAALNKSDIQCARIALVIAESMSPGAGGEIPAEAMRCAVAITGYAMDCWRALPDQESFALSFREERLNRKVDQLAGWLETRKAGRATRREIHRAAVAGVRTAGDLSTLLTEYAAVFPGMIKMERIGERGPIGPVVHAPRRHGNLSTAIVSADNYPESIPTDRPEETAGQRPALRSDPIVSAADNWAADSTLLTVPVTDHGNRGDAQTLGLSGSARAASSAPGAVS